MCVCIVNLSPLRNTDILKEHLLGQDLICPILIGVFVFVCGRACLVREELGVCLDGRSNINVSREPVSPPKTLLCEL